MDHFPDEIMAEILSPALKVSEEMFSDTASTSPFACPSVSSSAALLVCKAWLRVATPLLYHVVIIRSKAQARALQSSLRGNPDLGRFVKMLRVEGGFGPAMQDVLKGCPNVRDILLSLQIHGSDSTGGLVSGLPFINPTRIIIFDHPIIQLKNKQVQALAHAVESCTLTWTNLTTISFPYVSLAGAQWQSFVLNICACPTLRALSFPSQYTPDISVFIEISRHRSLKSIEFRSPASESPDLVEAVSTDRRLASIVRWLDEPKMTDHEHQPVSLRPTDPSFQPMASAPQEVVERVWSRSLEFAMLSLDAVPSRVLSPSHFPSGTTGVNGVYHDRLQYLFVSKMFHRLAVPLLYRHIASTRSGLFRRLSLQLASTPTVGEHVRSIKTSWDPFEPCEVHISTILRHTPQLTALINHEYGHLCMTPPLTWTMFETLGQTTGATLQKLSGFRIEVAYDSLPISPAVFGRFAALQSLDWDVGCRFPIMVPLFDPAAQVPRDTFPALESLHIGSSEGLDLFTEMDLPRLRRVDFALQEYRDPAFLQKHGHKLEELRIKHAEFANASILNLCPRISVLSYSLLPCTFFPQSGKYFGGDHLAPGFQHACVITLILNKLGIPSQVANQKDWKLCFDKLNLTYFPLLTEIRVAEIGEWPTTDHAISKSIWVKLAEKYLLQGIQLTNTVGARWHPRLKVSRSRR
ncbi:hypothetical protein DFH06DRAFT_1113337 [Mycena polygramma]|nr:hypothetical protein DFH06DRAFT_1113337 [Mycena polygramma]